MAVSNLLNMELEKTNREGNTLKINVDLNICEADIENCTNYLQNLKYFD